MASLKLATNWAYVLITLCLYVVLVVGVPLFPALMAVPLLGSLNLDMCLFLLLHLLVPLLAFIYLLQRRAAG